PSVRELAHGLKVNPNTVMRAYQELERDGLTEKRRGQGTYTTGSRTRVNEFTIKLAEETIEEFLKKMESIGYTWDDIQTCIRKKKGENR
ncbi:MAG TPA: GntR family transcriptional regulator, partial [Bacillales bacterium]|nr:GntR family transcriptional regulator [Bacillales bacterium]